MTDARELAERLNGPSNVIGPAERKLMADSILAQQARLDAAERVCRAANAFLDYLTKIVYRDPSGLRLDGRVPHYDNLANTLTAAALAALPAKGEK